MVFLENLPYWPEKKTKRLEEFVEHRRDDIEKAWSALDQHAESGGRKQEYYMEYQKLIEVDREAAQVLWEDKKLGYTWTQCDNRIADIKREGARKCIVEEELQFNPLKPQIQNKVVQNDFYFATNKRWKIVNSIFKTFQDIFSPVMCRIRPKKVERHALRNQGDYREGDPREYDRLPLKHCIVDPALISPRFLEVFGFPMPPEGSNPYQRLKFKEKLIPAIKAFFSKNVHPIPKLGGLGTYKNYRLYWTNGLDPEHNGKIIHTRDSKSRKTMQYFHSAYATRRKSEYVDKHYKDETPVIINIEAEVGSLHKELAYREGPLSETDKEKAKKKIAGWIKALGKAINYKKQTVSKEMKKISQLKDRLDRENIGMVCAKMLPLITKVKGVRKEVFSRHLHSKTDEKTMDNVILESEKLIDQYGEAFEGVLENGDVRPLGYHRSPTRLQIRPFNQYAAKLQNALDGVRDGMKEKDYKIIDHHSLVGLAATRLFKVEREREMVLLSLVRSSSYPDSEALLGECDRLIKSAQSNKVNSLPVSFDGVKEQLETLKDEITEKQSENTEPKDLYQIFKDRLKGIDFGASLEQI